MALIFDGISVKSTSDVVEAGGIVKINYACNPDDGGRLKIMQRPTGETMPFKPKIVKIIDGNEKSFMDKSDLIQVDLTGMEYYYEWEPAIIGVLIGAPEAWVFETEVIVE